MQRKTDRNTPPAHFTLAITTSLIRMFLTMRNHNGGFSAGQGVRINHHPPQPPPAHFIPNKLETKGDKKESCFASFPPLIFTFSKLHQLNPDHNQCRAGSSLSTESAAFQGSSYARYQSSTNTVRISKYKCTNSHPIVNVGRIYSKIN